VSFVWTRHMVHNGCRARPSPRDSWRTLRVERGRQTKKKLIDTRSFLFRLPEPAAFVSLVSPRPGRGRDIPPSGTTSKRVVVHEPPESVHGTQNTSITGRYKQPVVGVEIIIQRVRYRGFAWTTPTTRTTVLGPTTVLPRRD